MSLQQFPCIGFIGAGNMATALVGGLRAQGWPANRLWLSDRNEQQLEAHKSQGLRTTTDNAELLDKVEVIVLAVKPQVMASVLKPLAQQAQARRPLIISIAAGIPIDALARWLGGSVGEQSLPIVRAMPNTPSLVQAGATGLFASSAVSTDAKNLAERVMGAVGMTLWVEQEDLIDAVTAVSGSGPAYFFHVMEAMIAAGVKLGLSEQDARALTLQTALGAAQMAVASDVGPAELRKRVTSPGGTTERALRVFNESDLMNMFETALKACANRGIELALELSAAE
jgi:pyrroline-5-carboxylate reductase